MGPKRNVIIFKTSGARSCIKVVSSGRIKEKQQVRTRKLWVRIGAKKQPGYLVIIIVSGRD